MDCRLATGRIQRRGSHEPDGESAIYLTVNRKEKWSFSYFQLRPESQVIISALRTNYTACYMIGCELPIRAGVGKRVGTTALVLQSL